jgi:DNA-binding response OmpR family regulator
MKILIIEDEKELCDSIATFLSGEQYSCEKAADLPSAVDKIQLHDYACIILDINLPGGSGLELLKELKALGKTDGVLIISARDALDDRVKALRLGADDYLTKPFHLPELAARVEAIIRRRSFEGKNIISLGELSLNVNEKTILVNERELDLTRKEYDMLLYFISNKNKVVTKSAMAEHLWGDGMDDTGSFDAIYVHIKNLRKKIITAGGRDYIKSIYGLGYKFSVSS